MKKRPDNIMEKLLANFDRQRIIYEQMEDMAREQGALVNGIGEPSAEEGLMVFVRRRMQLMEEIESLSGESRALQNELITDLGLDEFVLTRLKGLVPTEQWESLRDQLANLGRLLQSIADLDAESQEHLSQLIQQREKRARQVPVNRVRSAYQQAMEQVNKDSSEKKP